MLNSKLRCWDEKSEEYTYGRRGDPNILGIRAPPGGLRLHFLVKPVFSHVAYSVVAFLREYICIDPRWEDRADRRFRVDNKAALILNVPGCVERPKSEIFGAAFLSLPRMRVGQKSSDFC